MQRILPVRTLPNQPWLHLYEIRASLVNKPKQELS